MATLNLRAFAGSTSNERGFTCTSLDILGRDYATAKVPVANIAETKAAVAAFGAMVAQGQPGWSFYVSATLFPHDRKPNGFDKARQTDAFGNRAWLRDKSELLPDDPAASLTK
jgi:hypothetical protein